MKMAHAYLKAGSRNIASALRKVWEFAKEQKMAYEVSLFKESRMTMTGQQLREMGFIKLD